MHRVVEARFREPVAVPHAPGREQKVLRESEDGVEMWRSGDVLVVRAANDHDLVWEVHMSNVRCHQLHVSEIPPLPSTKVARQDEPVPKTLPSSRQPVKRTRTKRSTVTMAGE